MNDMDLDPLREALRLEHNRDIALKTHEVFHWFVQALKVLSIPSSVALFDTKDLRRAGLWPANRDAMFVGLGAEEPRPPRERW